MKSVKKRKRPPGFFEAMKEQHPGLIHAYEAFAKATEDAGPLTRREQRLVKLGLVFGARMEGGAHAAVRKAIEAGITSEEIEHSAYLAMTTIGFPNAMACLSWARESMQP